MKNSTVARLSCLCSFHNGKYKAVESVAITDDLSQLASHLGFKGAGVVQCTLAEYNRIGLMVHCLAAKHRF